MILYSVSGSQQMIQGHAGFVGLFVGQTDYMWVELCGELRFDMGRDQ